MVAKNLRHKFHSLLADADDVSLVRPSNWNADHEWWWGDRLVTTATDTLTHDDNCSVIRYTVPANTGVRLIAPDADQFPLGWRVRLRHIGTIGWLRVVGEACTVNGRQDTWLQPRETLDIYGTGTNDYLGVKIPAADQFITGGRLEWQSPTQLRFRGQFFKHNGAIWPCSAVGPATLRNTNILITVGGENLDPATTYWVFVQERPAFRDLQANFRAAPHGVQHRPSQDSPGNEGTEILFIPPDIEHNTHTLIGMVRTDGAGGFSDAGQNRWVASWLNRRPRQIISSYAANVGTGSTAAVDPASVYSSFVTWSEDPILLHWGQGFTLNNTAGATNYLVFGLDGAVASPSGATTANLANVVYSISNAGFIGPSEGYHYVHPMISVTNGVGAYWGQLVGLNWM